MTPTERDLILEETLARAEKMAQDMAFLFHKAAQALRGESVVYLTEEQRREISGALVSPRGELLCGLCESAPVGQTERLQRLGLCRACDDGLFDEEE